MYFYDNRIRDDSGAFIFLHVGSKIISDVNEFEFSINFGASHQAIRPDMTRNLITIEPTPVLFLLSLMTSFFHICSWLT